MFWVLAISYWIHLLATIVWLGGIIVMVFIAWPALQQGSLADNQWLSIQRLSLLAGQRPEMAAAEGEKLRRKEIRLLRVNLICAVLVLLFTAIATAV